MATEGTARLRAGFIGLGLMGLPMATRLADAGVELAVWNRTPEKAAPLLDRGVTWQRRPADLAQASEVTLLVCVSDGKALEAVVLGADGVARANAPPGAVLVDHSSVPPALTRALAARLFEANGMGWIDAPVSGGVAGARDGTLAIMAGGEAGAIARVRPLLEVYAARVTHLGDTGCGQTAKLCNQMIVGCNLAVIAEALRLARQTGIDASKLFAAFEGGFADSKPLQIFGPRMLEPPAEPVAHIETVLKDLATALDVGAAVGCAMPMTERAGGLYRALVEEGLGRAEFDALLGPPEKA